MSSASKKKRRRRRPRSATPPEPQAAAPAEKQATPTRGQQRPLRRPVDEERPPAPWGSFPLVELVVLVGIVMIVLGFVLGSGEARGQTLLVTGVALASLAGLELSVREHFAGYRSHTTLLASATAVATLAVLFYVANLSGVASLVAAALVGGAAAWLLLRVFRARSGGRSFKIR